MTNWLSLEPVIERYEGTRAATIAEQRQIYEQVIEMRKQYPDAPFTKEHLGFNEQDGLTGSDLGDAILVNRTKVPGFKRMLTYEEAMPEDKKGNLPNGVYREFGLVVISPEGPNTQSAQPLLTEIARRKLVFPVIAQFPSLDLDKTGTQVLFSDNNSYIISGEEARAELEKFEVVGNSGVRGLYRSRGGYWLADAHGVWYSNSDGRMVDFIRCEATRENLEQHVIEELDEVARKKADTYLAHLDSVRQRAIQDMRRKQ